MGKIIEQLRDKEWLKKAYETLTTRQIASLLNCSQHGVMAALHRYGIETRKPDYRHVQQLKDPEWIKANYPKKTTAHIAQELNCHISVVQKAIVRLNLQWDKRILFPQLEDAAFLKERYAQVGGVALAREIGCSISAVFNAMRRRGVAPNGRGAHKKISALWNKELLSDLCEKSTAMEIAKFLKCSESAVRVALGRFGLKTTNGFMPKPRPVIRYFSEKKPNGRHSIPEHRFIMEKHLGRQLLTEEHVHHMDGNPHNNTLANLTIMSQQEHISHHHKNRKIPFICVTCGIEGIGGSYRTKYCDPCRKIAKKIWWTKANHARDTF